MPNALFKYSSLDFQAIFEAIPGSYLVLKPNAPDYTILAITDDLLQATGRKQEDTLGKGVFEIYPENPDAVTAINPSDLRKSLQNAIRYKQSDSLPVVRYAVPDATGVFEARYRSASSKPVLDKEGNVLYIIHATNDSTHQIKAEQQQRTLSEIEDLYNLFLKAPLAVCIVTGPENVVQLANEEMLHLLGRTKDIIGEPLFASLPEAIKQGLPELLDQVRKTSKPFYAKEQPATLIRNGQEELRYYHFVFQPYYQNPTSKEVAGVFSIAHDVTEQVLARKSVEESEQQVRDIIASSHHPIGVYIGQELQIQFANQGLMDGLGKGNHIIGKRYKELLPELENQGIFEKLDQVLATGIPYHTQNQKVDLIVAGKAKTYYFNFSLTPLINTAGEVYGIVNTGADITDLNEARQKVEESESRFRNMVEQAPVAIALTRGQDVVIESINAPMLRILGKESQADVVGKKMVEVLPEIKDQPIFEVVQQVLASGKAFRGNEVPVSLRVGKKLEEHYFDISLTPIMEEGKIRSVLHIAVDVTEQVRARKEVENKAEELKRFKFMADQAQDPFILMREDGTFAYLNQKALEAWGYTEEEARYIRVPDVDPVYHEKLFAGLFARAQRETIPQFESQHKRKDGYIYPVELKVNGLSLEGKPHLLAIARDITERKQADAALEFKNAQLTRTNTDLDNFVYTASHDLRSPITNIEGLVHLLREELTESHFSTTRTEEILQRIGDSVNRFKHTIADLTDISRLQQDSSPNPDNEIINLPEVYHNIMVDLDYPGERGACSVLTNFQVQQLGFSRRNFRSVLYNLISNAVKYYSSERDCIIQIDTWREESYVVLRVKDNGLGMSERQQEQLYSMFKRFHDHVEGTGVGLYMVKRIVDNAGGRIEVASQLGVGTEFKVYFKADS